MSVSRGQIIKRGLANECPNCGHHSLFPKGSFRIRRRCPDCSTGFDRGDGFFLGPWVLNYTIVVFVFVLPAIVLGVRGIIPWGVSLGISAFGCAVIPLLLYRSTWSWWLMLYFFFLPERLPANGGADGSDEED